MLLLEMIDGHKIVVTQTSWKKRIGILAQSITQFLCTQTIRPDEYHIWLSLDEFPNREKDLPNQLIIVIKLANIKLHWLEGNQYCHKRWNIYPQHYDSYVVSIDDDCIYSPMMIADSIQQLKKFPNAVCNIWKQFNAIPTYDNDIKITFKYISEEISKRLWFCANSVFPPNIFPIEALTIESISLRNKYSPKNDEVWLIPFLIKYDIPLTCINRPTIFNTIEKSQENSLYLKNGQYKDKNGYSNKEKELYWMLKATNMLEKYKQLHKGYSYDKFEQTL